MLSFSDDALILKVDKFGDKDAILHLFAAEHGLVRGVVKRGFSGKAKADLQPGTLVRAEWKARLEEHLGTVTLEARHGYASRVMHDPLRLAAIGSIVQLLTAALAERDPHPELYQSTLHFLQHVAAGVEKMTWLAEYVRLELFLLEQAGFGLDLSQCAATGARDGLAYVSPKSARAVCRTAGEPYHGRLLPLPLFLAEAHHHPESLAEIAEGVRLTGYFIEERLLPALHRPNPALRAHFEGLLGRKVNAA